MTIQPMHITDFLEICRMWAETPGIGMSALDDSRTSIRTFLARNATTCFVAREKGAIIGAILSGHDGRRGSIYHIAVHPENRRKGVGRDLVQAVIDAMRKENIEKVVAIDYIGYPGSGAFWQSVGFSTRDVALFDRVVEPESDGGEDIPFFLD